MDNLPRYYDPLFKQRLVEYYLKNQPNVSFRFVANLFQIMGGHKTVRRWFDRYDGTVASLQQKYRSGRPPILNKQQVNKLITKVVRSHIIIVFQVPLITLKSQILFVKKQILMFLFERFNDMDRTVVLNIRKPSSELTQKVSVKAFSHRLLVICCLF